MKGTSIIAVGAASLLLGSCTVGPDFLRPKAPAETRYTPGADEQKPAGDQHFALGQKITGNWWTLYHSPPMNEVLEASIAGNRTLAAAEATLAAAQQAVVEAEGPLFPQVDLNAAALRQHINGTPFGLPKLPPTFPAYSNNFRVGGTVSYMVDAFGLTRRTVEQAAAQADASDFELDAAYLSLTGNAVTQAITIASLRAQIVTVDGIIADDQTNLRLVQTEVNAGTATQLDIEQAQAQLETDRTLRPPLSQALAAADHALAVLTGRIPADWSPPDFDLDKMTLPTDLPVTLPSDLVRQRPDILASEAQLHAASAAIGIATAELYPNFTLSAALSQQSISMDSLFSLKNQVGSVTGGVTYPLFHGGALEAQKQRAEDLYQSSLATYEQTVLQSFDQVADVLDALGHDAELLSAQQRALAASQSSLDLNRRSYSLGNIGILQVLDAQRQLEQARLGYVRARAQRYLDTAQLFVALGGAWWDWREKDTGSTEPVSAPAR
ncbi:MAG TPA: efflux transporter outer membrane subunit [Stellaceae bacterium]|nr:efflux transporter outer membrane subunit [Stellaceae bacterium]